MPKLTLAAFALLVVAAPTAAQGTMTSPKGYLSKAGDRYSYYFGRYAEGRYQLADGELTNNKLSVTRLDFRLDAGRNYTTSTGMGRTWTRVTLDMGEADLNAMTNDWDLTNHLVRPTRVFDSAVTWPTVSGRPSSTPWGRVSFPFTTTWVYSGNNAMLSDYKFLGGKLSNSGAWSGLTSRYYYLDGVFNQDFTTGPGVYRPASRPRCNDSAITVTNGAFSFGQASVYDVNHSTHTYRDKVRLLFYSYYTAPNAQVTHGLGTGLNTAGIDIGAVCNKLYVDPARPFLVFNRTAANTSSAFSGNTILLFPYYKAWTGISFHVQSAWTDSKTGRLSLTQARSFSVPAAPTQAIRKRMVYHYRPDNSVGSGPVSSWAAQGLVRVSYR